MLVDTHCHLDQGEFDADRDDVIARATEANVLQIITVGINASSSESAIALAQKYDVVFAAVGIQPNSIAETQPTEWDEIVKLVDQPNVVAIGETGLDRYWDMTPFEQQQDYFDRHIRLSQQRNLPFIVHMRDCEEDLLTMLREARRRGSVKGVMHSYTGSCAGAAECAELGMHISFAGMVTYKKSDELRACAATVADEQILIETDSPYLSPQPVRKIRRNEPAHVVHTLNCLAELRGVSPEKLAAQTTRNAEQLFGLP